MLFLSRIYLYRCDEPSEYEIDNLVSYLKKIYPKAKLVLRDDFFSQLEKNQDSFDVDALAEKITLCRVHNVNQEVKKFVPLPLEIGYEKKRLKEKKQLKGIIYDGFLLQSLFQQLIAPKEQNLLTCHIIFTNQLIASFDQADKRYHLRVGIYGFPNIISTAGLMEALAKPREYYLKMQMGRDKLDLEKEFRDKVINYGDSRIPGLLKGYCLQALFNHLEGSAFCEDKNCRLYNAHWQKEALIAQTKGEYEFCPRHFAIISRWQI